MFQFKKEIEKKIATESIEKQVKDFYKVLAKHVFEFSNYRLLFTLQKMISQRKACSFFAKLESIRPNPDQKPVNLQCDVNKLLIK